MFKNPPVNVRDTRDLILTPELGRSPGGGHGNSLQYSCLENPVEKYDMTEVTSHTQQVNLNYVFLNVKPPDQRLHIIWLYLYVILGKAWRRKWQPTPVLLPGKSHGQRNPVGYSPWGHDCDHWGPKSQTRLSDFTSLGKAKLWRWGIDEFLPRIKDRKCLITEKLQQ